MTYLYTDITNIVLIFVLATIIIHNKINDKIIYK